MMKKLKFYITCCLLLAACAAPRSWAPAPPPAPGSMAAALQYPFPVNTLRLPSGIDIAWAEAGPRRGVPMLFIHGLGSSMRAWDKNIAALSATHRCIRVDLPGYGKSGKGDYQANMTFNADQVAAFCEALQLKKVMVVGHSMGGQIALHLALRRPNLVEKLVLVSPAGFETFTDVQKTTLKNFTKAEGIRAATEAQIRQNFSANFYRLPDDVQFMVDDRLNIRNSTDFDQYCHVVAQNVYGMLDEPVFARLPDIAAPVLCLYGKNDALIPNKYLHADLDTEKVARAGTSALKNATLHLIDQAGHFAMWEKAEAVNQHILKFIQQ